MGVSVSVSPFTGAVYPCVRFSVHLSTYLAVFLCFLPSVYLSLYTCLQKWPKLSVGLPSVSRPISEVPRKTHLVVGLLFAPIEGY